MATQVSPADIVLWLKVSRPHGDLDALDWGATPLRQIADDARQADLLSFGAEPVLADEEARSKFARALTAVRASATVVLRADVALSFSDVVAAQSFLLPADLLKSGWGIDEIEVSVYSTES